MISTEKIVLKGNKSINIRNNLHHLNVAKNENISEGVKCLKLNNLPAVVFCKVHLERSAA